jgi:hypothetical protein
MAFDDQLEGIRRELGSLITRLDDLVYDSIRAQLHGEDLRTTEKRLARARNGLRRAQILLDPVGEEELGED